MGEWSKKIGEYGENVVERFLSVVGWQGLAKGNQIRCSKLNGEHLNQEGKAVNTHGIDFLYSYMNPLVDGQLNNIVISSKFKTEKYPNSPTTEFKWFMTDLINMLECFDYSELKNSLLQHYNYSTVNDVGVLFWLNNQEVSQDDLISIVSSAKFDIVRNNTIYIVDNKRAGFILEVMRYIKTQDKFSYSFYYPITGQNINPMNRMNTGDILPVEFLNSSIIPIKLVNKENDRETCLFLGTIDGFEQDTLMRLIGLAYDISTNLAGKIIIGFPDYSELSHKEIVATTKQGFQNANFTKTVSVINFTNPINAF